MKFKIEEYPDGRFYVRYRRWWMLSWGYVVEKSHGICLEWDVRFANIWKINSRAEAVSIVNKLVNSQNPKTYYIDIIEAHD